ncbi:MAG: lysophospholipid acyltransferase family protein [Candidatus Hydrogenedentota bacterium]|nr:MAG: lysophospholipid acyltransferase family protein [Candidatus Hydrogenedentota bacterium]
MLEYLMYFGAVFLATVFPLRPLYWIARRIADIHHFFDRKGRAAVKENLRVMTGGKLDDKALKKSVKQTYYHFSLYLAEFFRMKRLDREYFDSHVKIVGIEKVDAALEQGKGVVIVSAHYSNWELGLAYLCMSGYPSYVIVASHKNKKVNDLFLGPRINAGARPIPTENAIEEGYRALQSNGILILLADRVTTKGGVETTFFGHTATFPKGPAKFAIGARAPLMPAYIIRQPGNTFILTFDDPIYTDDMSDDEESVRRLMNAYARRFEAYIRRDPTQYGVFYKIWKDADNPVRSVQNKNPV